MSARPVWPSLGLVVVLIAVALAVTSLPSSTGEPTMITAPVDSRTALIEVGTDISLDELDWSALWLKAEQSARLPPSDAELKSVILEHDPRLSVLRFVVVGNRADGWELTLVGFGSPDQPQGGPHYLRVEAIHRTNEGTLYYSPLPSVTEAMAALEKLDWRATLHLLPNRPADGEDILIWECRPGSGPPEVALASKAFVWSGEAFRPLKPTPTNAGPGQEQDPVARLPHEKLLVLSAVLIHRGHQTPPPGVVDRQKLFLVPLGQ